MWYLWPTQAAFDEWHAVAKSALGLPKPGINQATGEIDETAQWTTECANAVPTSVGVVAFVSEEISLAAPDLLGEPTDSPYPPSEMKD